MTETQNETPQIGSFKRPPEKKPDPTPMSPGKAAITEFMKGAKRSEVPVSKVGTKNEPAQDLEEHVDELERLADEVGKLPELTYEEKLEQHGISLEEALNIISKIVDDGFYERKYHLTSKVPVVFRTREEIDQERTLHSIEAVNPRFPATVSNIVSKHNLAISMVEFKGQDFRKKSLEDRLKFVERLPEVLFRALAAKLAKFDRLMLDVLDEGAIANF